MWRFVLQSGIMGYGTGTLWDLCDRLLECAMCPLLGNVHNINEFLL